MQIFKLSYFLAFFVLTLSTASVYGGIPKSPACLLMLEYLSHDNPSKLESDKVYSLNSFKAKAEYFLQKSINDVSPNTAEGLMSPPHYTSGFDPVQAAGRVRGILDFMRQPEGESPQDKKFILVGRIDGKENIAHFIEDYENKIKQSSTHGKTLTFGWWLQSLLSLSLSYNVPILSPLLLPFTFAGIESSLRAAFLAESSLFKKTINKISLQVDHWDQGEWLLGSLNFSIIKSSVENRLNRRGDFNSNSYQYSWDISPKGVLYLLSVLDRKVLETENKKKIGFDDRIWVGLDFLLTSGLEGEPELHIIMRGTHKSPPFPKTSKEQKEENQLGLEPILAPGLTPAGIPVKN